MFDWRVLTLCLALGAVACDGDDTEAEAPGEADGGPGSEVAADRSADDPKPAAPNAVGADGAGLNAGAQKEAALKEARDPGEAGAGQPVAAKGVVPDEAATPGRPASPEPLPPTLAPGALRDELRRASQAMPGQRQHLQEERAALAEERLRLEEMAAGIESARAALKEETTRLESLLKSRPAAAGARPSAPSASEAPSAPQPLEGDRLDLLAKSVRGMRAEQAAALLAKLPRPLAAGLILRLRPAEAGQILEKLPAEVAADLVGQVLALPAQEAS